MPLFRFISPQFAEVTGNTNTILQPDVVYLQMLSLSGQHLSLDARRQMSLPDHESFVQHLTPDAKFQLAKTVLSLLRTYPSSEFIWRTNKTEAQVELFLTDLQRALESGSRKDGQGSFNIKELERISIQSPLWHPFVVSEIKERQPIENKKLILIPAPAAAERTFIKQDPMGLPDSLKKKLMFVLGQVKDTTHQARENGIAVEALLNIETSLISKALLSMYIEKGRGPLPLDVSPHIDSFYALSDNVAAISARSSQIQHWLPKTVVGQWLHFLTDAKPDRSCSEVIKGTQNFVQ